MGNGKTEEKGKRRNGDDDDDVDDDERRDAGMRKGKIRVKKERWFKKR